MHNWVELLSGVALLNTESVSLSDIEEAKEHLKLFYMGFTRLYGKVNCSLNIHLIIHLADSVQIHGPLWSTSLYINESFNRVLLNSFRTGSKGILAQISERLQWRMKVAGIYSVLRTQDSINLESLSLAERVWSLELNDHVKVYGKPYIVAPSLNDCHLFEDPEYQNIISFIGSKCESSDVIKFYHRVDVNGFHFTTKGYHSALGGKKKDVYFYSKTLDVIGSIQHILTVGCDYYFIYRTISSSPDMSCLPPNFKNIRYIRKVDLQSKNNLEVCSTDYVTGPCFELSCEIATFFCLPHNGIILI